MAHLKELPELLRAWRDRIEPAAVGFPRGGMRRTSGLRREEVAILAGLSVDYLVQLEQGRADRPSANVVASLARALQLSEPERDQFYIAAGLPAPVPKLIPTQIPASVERLLNRLSDVAIGVYTLHWTLLSANSSWVALLGPSVGELNLIARQFNGTGVQVVRNPYDTERFERALVSDLRTALIRYPEDPSVRNLAQTLREGNDRFATMWAEGRILEHRSERKTFVHGSMGNVTLSCDILTVSGTDLRIITYTAEPGSDDAAKFDLIRSAQA